MHRIAVRVLISIGILATPLLLSPAALLLVRPAGFLPAKTWFEPDKEAALECMRAEVHARTATTISDSPSARSTTPYPATT